MSPPFGAALALVFLLCGAQAWAQEPEFLKLSSENATVEFLSGDGTKAAQTAATIEDGQQRILRQLGIPPVKGIRVILVRGRRQFNAECGKEMPEWALAAAIRGQTKIVADIALATPATANDIHLAMMHELVHLALFEAERQAPGRPSLPLWFHEGVATVLSGRLPIMVDRSIFKDARERGDLIPLEELTGSFPSGERDAQLAYLQSEVYVNHLVGRAGPDILRRILREFQTHGDFELAFETVMGQSLAQVDKEWRQTQRRRFPWVRALFRSMSFWSMMALATIIVFLLVQARARRQRKQWADEERMFTVAGDEPDVPDAGEDAEPWEDDDDY